MARVGWAMRNHLRVMNRPLDPREECECKRGRIKCIPDPKEQEAFVQEALASVARGEGIPPTPQMHLLCDLCARKAGWIK